MTEKDGKINDLNKKKVNTSKGTSTVGKKVIMTEKDGKVVDLNKKKANKVKAASRNVFKAGKKAVAKASNFLRKIFN